MGSLDLSRRRPQRDQLPAALRDRLPAAQQREGTKGQNGGPPQQLMADDNDGPSTGRETRESSGAGCPTDLRSNEVLQLCIRDMQGSSTASTGADPPMTPCTKIIYDNFVFPGFLISGKV